MNIEAFFAHAQQTKQHRNKVKVLIERNGQTYVAESITQAAKLLHSRPENLHKAFNGSSYIKGYKITKLQ